VCICVCVCESASASLRVRVCVCVSNMTAHQPTHNAPRTRKHTHKCCIANSTRYNLLQKTHLRSPLLTLSLFLSLTQTLPAATLCQTPTSGHLCLRTHTHTLSRYHSHTHTHKHIYTSVAGQTSPAATRCNPLQHTYRRLPLLTHTHTHIYTHTHAHRCCSANYTP